MDKEEIRKEFKRRMKEKEKASRELERLFEIEQKKYWKKALRKQRREENKKRKEFLLEEEMIHVNNIETQKEQPKIIVNHKLSIEKIEEQRKKDIIEKDDRKIGQVEEDESVPFFVKMIAYVLVVGWFIYVGMAFLSIALAIGVFLLFIFILAKIFKD